MTSAQVSPAQRAPARDAAMLAVMLGDGRLREAEQQARAMLQQQPGAGLLWKTLGVALLRQGGDALPALTQAAALLPEDAEVHANLGTAFSERGRWPAALASLLRALELAPDQVATLIDAANALRALARPREAVPLYQRALQLDPRSAEAQNNLGNAFLELVQPAAAAGCYERALELKPQNGEICCNLANSLRQLGRLEEAAAFSERSIALEPRLSMAHNNLGLCLAGLGRRKDAVASYRRALQLNAGYVEALNNLGNALRASGEPREALELHRKAVELDPRRPESHCNAGDVLFDLRRLEEAAQGYRRALDLKSDCVPAHLGLAAVLRMQQRPDEAETSCRAALALEPGSVEALNLLGELRTDRGDFAEAQQIFERALKADPGCATVYASIAAHRKMSEADSAWLQGATGALARQLPLLQEVSLRYALGKYFDDLGRYDDAFSHFRRANELSKRSGPHYDRAQQTLRVGHLISTLDATFIGNAHPAASSSDLPVFIIGMPRSGTSLAEQILASHPCVAGAGEVQYWGRALAALEAAGLNSERAASLMPGMAHDYLQRVASLSGSAERVIDKMPGNFFYAGLIHAAFPRARIIHMQRHPVDTCLSIYFQNFFEAAPYAHDLEDLAHSYLEYLVITDHWRSVLPASALLEVPYEGLIREQEGWTRRMLEFIGLPWDPQCLKFHETERVVITASRWQVRQDLYSASAGRWRNYEKYLDPLRHLLDFTPRYQQGPELATRAPTSDTR